MRSIHLNPYRIFSASANRTVPALRRVTPASIQSGRVDSPKRTSTTTADIRILHTAGRPKVGVSWIPQGHIRCFHTTPRREGWPVLGYTLLSVFKSSGALEIARLVGRVTLSLSTLVLLKNFGARKKLRHFPQLQQPEYEAKRTQLLTGLRRRTVLFHALLFAPALLFWIAIMASLERTPLTGRWRTILLSPEEEEEIAAQLANGGWYNAVAEIVSQDGPVTIIPPTDWRYQWAEGVLRQLERTIPLIQREQLSEDWVGADPSGIPFPPPAEYPLRARPRASEYLRSICEAMVNKHTPPSSHAIPGAPYSLMLVDDPNASNAFSYGFGPDGAGGIVVFTGFFDSVLARASPENGPCETQPPPKPRSWFSAIFGGLTSPSPSSSPPAPTADQTSELATLMAHELAHLVLAHHLETLSSGTIVVPGFISLVTDFVRVLVFPITMVFGPFVNDALANVGKASTLDLARMGEHCTSVYQEVEADVVSMRLLAYAGFDARDAVRFWERRVEANPNTECKASRVVADPTPPPAPGTAAALTRKITGDDHPIAETRILRLREELQRWDELRLSLMEERQAAEP